MWQSKGTQVHTKFYTQLKDLYNNKSWKILILDDANNSLEELMETLVFLESLEALVIPVVLEAPYRPVIDAKEDKKGLKATDVYDAADNVYDRGELLFSAYDPIFLKRPLITTLMACDNYQKYNDRASEEEKHTSWQIHKEILSHKPGEAATSHLFQKQSF